MFKHKMELKTKVRQWGNSKGIIIPNEIDVSIGDVVSIEISKIADLTDVFGTIKTDVTGQKFKDEVKKGWK